MKPALRWLVIVILLCAVAHFSNQPTDQQKDLRPFLQSHPRVVEYLKMLPRVQFYYTGSLVDSARDPVKFWGFFVLRKAVHMVFYGSIGLALVWALRGSGLKAWKAWMLALMILAVIAGSDELNQYYSHGGRTGCLDDVCLDLGGFLMFGLLVAAVGVFRSGEPAARG